MHGTDDSLYQDEINGRHATEVEVRGDTTDRVSCAVEICQPPALRALLEGADMEAVDKVCSLPEPPLHALSIHGPLYPRQIGNLTLCMAYRVNVSYMEEKLKSSVSPMPHGNYRYLKSL